MKPKDRTAFPAFVKHLRSLHPPEVQIAIVLDNLSPHLSTKNDTRVGDWAPADNGELAYTPTYWSWLNWIEAEFQGLRYFTLDGTDHTPRRTSLVAPQLTEQQPLLILTSLVTAQRVDRPRARAIRHRLFAVVGGPSTSRRLGAVRVCPTDRFPASWSTSLHRKPKTLPLLIPVVTSRT